MNNTNQSKTPVSFAAIDPYIETHIVKPTETLLKSKDMVEYGENNSYPDYLLGLYDNVSTLRSIINGNVDFISGDDVIFNIPNKTLNGKGDTARNIVRSLALDKEIYGGFALQVIRAMDGTIAEVHYIDLRFLRANKECNVFYYSEDWGKSRRNDVITYPAYMKDLDWNSLDDNAKAQHASSILYVKDTHTQTYPSPLYAASVKACEIERCIDDFHLNAINNGFVSSVIVNFNNGVPEDEIKKEIERNMNEKFSGHQNAGRMMLSWNKDKDHEVTISEPKLEDFGEKYNALAKHSRQQIFTAFRAIPALFGINPDNNGFSDTEYEESFKLYNRTQIKPIQDSIIDAFETIYGKGAITIKPFSLRDESSEQEDEAKEMLAVQIGVGGTQSLTSIIADPTLSSSQKEQLLIKLFNFTPEEAHKLFEEDTNTIKSEE